MQPPTAASMMAYTCLPATDRACHRFEGLGEDDTAKRRPGKAARAAAAAASETVTITRLLDAELGPFYLSGHRVSEQIRPQALYYSHKKKCCLN